MASMYIDVASVVGGVITRPLVIDAAIDTRSEAIDAFAGQGGIRWERSQVRTWMRKGLGSA
jgi:hypothetical protein